MPLYEYECREHGDFELVRAMSESSAPAPCPWCQRESPRMLSAPALHKVSHATRVALDRNERSRHEPKILKRVAAANSAAPERPKLKSSHGRPWALEHG